MFTSGARSVPAGAPPRALWDAQQGPRPPPAPDGSGCCLTPTLTPGAGALGTGLGSARVAGPTRQARTRGKLRGRLHGSRGLHIRT